MAKHVFLMMLLTVFLPILYEKDMLWCELPKAKYLMVNASLYAGSVACLITVEFLLLCN